jgi:hypothetical protein
MEAIDFIDSGIAGFPGFTRGARAKTSIRMTKLYLVQLAKDLAKVLSLGKNLRRSPRDTDKGSEAEAGLRNFRLSAGGEVTATAR